MHGDTDVAIRFRDTQARMAQACETPPSRSPACRRTSTRTPTKPPDGVKSLRLNGAEVGIGLISLRAKGEHLSDRPLGFPVLPLSGSVHAQLEARDGLCWEASFSSPQVSTSARYVAGSD